MSNGVNARIVGDIARSSVRDELPITGHFFIIFPPGVTTQNQVNMPIIVAVVIDKLPQSSVGKVKDRKSVV